MDQNNEITSHTTLVGMNPEKVLPHGPTKLYVDEYIWHAPHIGIVASYTPKERDVHDHFGIFRGVDQVESFAQATVVSCSAFLETKKMKLDYEEYYKTINVVALGLQKVFFKDIIRFGEKFISIGAITFYKFRQMVATGRIYKAPVEMDLVSYFKEFSESRLRNYDISKDFTLAAEIHEVIIKGIKIDKMNFLQKIKP